MRLTLEIFENLTCHYVKNVNQNFSNPLTTSIQKKCLILNNLYLGLLLEHPSTSPSLFKLDEADRHLFLGVFVLEFEAFIILHKQPFWKTKDIRINDNSDDQLFKEALVRSMNLEVDSPLTKGRVFNFDVMLSRFFCLFWFWKGILQSVLLKVIMWYSHFTIKRDALEDSPCQQNNKLKKSKIF